MRSVGAGVIAFAYFVLLAFVPLCCLLFRRVDAATAIVTTTIGGFLFLPVMQIGLPGLPDLTKTSAISLALLLGTSFFTRSPPPPWRHSVLDLFMVGHVLALPLAYLANDFPPYSAMSAVVDNALVWGVPYYVGRRYLSDPRGISIMVRGCFVGALIYVPLCLWEVRMSPQLHLKLYGWFQHDFGQMMRSGGFRPIVFTRHGLEVALWLATGFVAGLGLWKRGGLRQLFGVPLPWLLGALAAALLLCKSLGSLLIAVAMVPVVWFRRGPVLIAVYLAIASTYILARVFLGPEIYGAIAEMARWVPPDRAASFMFRVDMEEVMMRQAWVQPWFGWTMELAGIQLDPWADQESRVVVVTDSLWILSFLQSGLLGLFSIYGLLCAACLRHLPTMRWGGRFGDHLLLAAFVGMQVLDSVPNAMIAPTNILAAGALVAGLRFPAASTLAAVTAAPSRLLRPRRRAVTCETGD